MEISNHFDDVSLDGKSMDVTNALLEQLKAIVPQAFSEGKLDTKQLKLLLGEDLFVQGERYGLSWAGKTEAYKVLQQRTTSTLLPNIEESFEWDTAQHVFIEGENLDVLKLLQKNYFGKVKMIYIDPPYNTGSDSFIYPDKFSETKAEYLQRIGDKDEDGNVLRQGAFRKNSKENGQYHSNWLNMMLPRLYLARNLLRDDGVIFISIDDNEQANLKLLMDEIFGAGNFIGSVIWKNVTDNNPSNIATEHETIIVFSKNKECIEKVWKSKQSMIKDSLALIEKELLKNYKNDDLLQAEYTKWFRANKFQLGMLDRYKYIDIDGIYTGSQSVHNPGKDGYRYDVMHPITQKPCKQPLMGYRFPESTMKELLAQKKILFGDDHNKIIELKVYAKDFVDKLSSVFDLDGRLGAYNLRALFPEAKTLFTNPKPVKLLSHFFSFVLNKDDLILDFFTGSGSTAQALIELNEEDGGNRKYICVQLPELTDETSETFKSGYKTISQVTHARINKVIEKIKSERNNNPDLLKGGKPLPNLGYRKFTLAPSNFKQWREDTIENEDDLIKQAELFVNVARNDVQPIDMVWEMLIKNQVELTESITQETLAEGHAIYYPASKRFAMVLDGWSDAIQTRLIELKPKKVLLLDTVFAKLEKGETIKTNAKLKLQESGIDFHTFNG